MSRLLARYVPSRRYLWLASFAIGGASFSAWSAIRWTPSWIAAGLFLLSAIGILLVGLRPPIEIRETHLLTGRKAIPWDEVRRVDQTRWRTPLAVYLTLADGTRLLLLYPGDLDSSSSLLRHIRRCSREALLDGVPYREFWGEPTAIKSADPAPAKYPLLRPEDEEEVERMFQRLKSVGRLDARGSDEN